MIQMAENVYQWWVGPGSDGVSSHLVGFGGYVKGVHANRMLLYRF